MKLIPILFIGIFPVILCAQSVAADELKAEHRKEIFTDKYGTLYDNDHFRDKRFGASDFKAWNWDGSFESNVLQGIGLAGEEGDHHYYLAEIKVPMISELIGISVLGDDDISDKDFRISIYEQDHLFDSEPRMLYEAFTNMIDGNRKWFISENFEDPILVDNTWRRYFLKIAPINTDDIGLPGEHYTSWEDFDMRIFDVIIRYRQP